MSSLFTKPLQDRPAVFRWGLRLIFALWGTVAGAIWVIWYEELFLKAPPIFNISATVYLWPLVCVPALLFLLHIIILLLSFRDKANWRWFRIYFFVPLFAYFVTGAHAFHEFRTNASGSTGFIWPKETILLGVPVFPLLLPVLASVDIEKVAYRDYKQAIADGRVSIRKLIEQGMVERKVGLHGLLELLDSGRQIDREEAERLLLDTDWAALANAHNEHPLHHPLHLYPDRVRGLIERLMLRPEVSDTAIIQFYNTYRSHLFIVMLAQRPELPMEILLNMASSDDVDIRHAALNAQVPLPEDRIRQLAEQFWQSTEPRDREYAAACPFTDASILDKLADDPKSSVRSRAASNRKTPASALIRLAHDAEMEVLLAVAGNPNTPFESLEAMARKHRREAFLMSAVMHNPSLSKQQYLTIRRIQ